MWLTGGLVLACLVLSVWTDVIKCPDGTRCFAGNTCCQLENGTYGCCAHEEAVCCKDKIHCCPKNTHCDLKHQKCIKGDLSIPWLKKVPTVPTSSTNKASRPRVLALGNITCPDGKVCSRLSTCCEHFEGDWACCPMPHAVCCKDHHHCCGRDTICDPTTDKCLSHALHLPWQEMMPTRSSHPENPKHITVGGIKEEQEGEQTESRSQCPDGTPCTDNETCCKGKEIGQWGCCPLPHAVCCEDHEHCCPQFTKCDVAKLKCNDGKMAVPWFKKSPSLGSSSTLDNSPSGITAHKTEKTQTLGVLHCNDGQFCGFNQTCCEQPNGVWGCCPFPQAVCCKDHHHCCARDTICDPTTDKCLSHALDLPWQETMPTRSSHPENPKHITVGGIKEEQEVEQTESRTRCPDGTPCTDNETCCKGKEIGQWGCCPLPHAVCCEDHEYCCPQFTKCDATKGKCDDGKMAVPWFKKSPSLGSSSTLDNSRSGITAHNTEKTQTLGVLHCNDGQFCGFNQTCCEEPNGVWSCCPFPQAVCCKDHHHCCARDTICDPTTDKCLSHALDLPWQEMMPTRSSHPENPKHITVGGIKEEQEVEQTESITQCPDGTPCTDNGTCCKGKEIGQWGCCPFPHAVCCEDHEHCCPQFTKCDLAKETCDDGKMAVPWFKKSPSLGSSSTLDSSPSGITAHKTEKTQTLGVLHCDDDQFCGFNQTCCEEPNGVWGCCPFPQAVCCKDHHHCCARDTICDPTTDKCLSHALDLPWQETMPTRSSHPENPKHITVGGIKEEQEVEQTESRTRCPDGTPCTDNGTCCKGKEIGQWGCCPLPHAVCCEDHEYCCPQFTKCDATKGKCDDGKMAVPWFKKSPSLGSSSTLDNSRSGITAHNTEKTQTLGVLHCNDGQFCGFNQTCCEEPNGVWSCCPFPQAVCCKDHHHCCARDTICDPTTDKCLSHALDLPWQEMMPTRSSHPENPKHITVGGIKEEQEVEQTESITQCPDGTPCTDNGTCCKGKEIGQWGCCPFPHAVCCEDHEHCCPQFTKCDLAKETCDDGKMAVPWFKKSPSLGSSSTLDSSPSGITAHKTEKTQTLGVLHCDDDQFCGFNQTCCEEPNGVWGCCPFPQAVCCKDHHHCCARDTICDPTTDKCLSHALDLPWQETMPTRSSHPENPKHITVGGIREEQEVEQTESITQCPDGTPCTDNGTCCKGKEIGQWGCCPFPHAVCCEDHEHCCPQFTKCDLAKETCDDGKMAVPWFKKSPSLGSSSTLDNSPSGITAHKTEKTQTLGVLHCNDGQFCGFNQTCCEEPNGVWGCCPFPQAICCKDHKNCCPQGTRCDLQTSKCVKGHHRDPDLLMFNNDLL